MKHVNGLVCPACEQKLLLAHPELVRWFRESVKPRFHDAHISWSWRGAADQALFFQQGRSKLKYPMSAHNKMDDHGNPCSMALDLFELDFNGIARWSWGYFRDVAAVDSDIRIIWGGTFKTIGDSDHFQLDAAVTGSVAS